MQYISIVQNYYHLSTVIGVRHSTTSGAEHGKELEKAHVEAVLLEDGNDWCDDDIFLGNKAIFTYIPSFPRLSLYKF